MRVAKWKLNPTKGLGRRRPKLETDEAWADRLPTEPDSLTVVIPIATPNPLNGSHRHWQVRARIARDQREAVSIAFIGHQIASFAPGCTITVTRVSAGKLSEEAVPGALKHIRDQIAVLLLGGKPGQRDDDIRLEWVYKQLRGPRGSAAVVVTLTPRAK